MDAGVDEGVDGRWLTYAELAEIRRIDKASALKLAIRHKWTRRRDNHGRMQVHVPVDWAVPPDRQRDVSMDASTPPSMHLSTILAAHEDAKAAFAEALKQAEARADQDRLRADRAEAKADAMQERLNHMAIDLEVARHDAETAQQAAATLRQADEARKARGRLRRAWDGWRGR